MKDDASKPPTLKTIAEITGLSLSTVSLSLRDGSRLKKETREKVAKAAAEVGYVPNRAGVRLRTGQTNVLTLVLAADRHAMGFTRQLIHGIGAHLLGSAYHLNVIPELAVSDPLQSVRYVLGNKTSDGVILTHTSARDPRVQMLQDAGFPFVTHGRTEFFADHPFVDLDAAAFVQMAVTRLRAKGRSRLLLVTPDNGTMYFLNTMGEFRRVSASDASANVVTDASCLSNADQTRKLAHDLATGAGRADGIICTGEMSAIALLQGYADKGLHCGQDYDLVSRQTTDTLPALFPQMDTLHEDLMDAGQLLAELLISRVQGAPAGGLQRLYAPRPGWDNQGV